MYEPVAIAENVLADIRTLAKLHHPEECGGLVAQWTDTQGSPWQLCIPIENEASEPLHNYAGKASETVAAYEFIDDLKDGVFLFEWHTHPTAPAEPSDFDKNGFRATDNRLLFLISLWNNGDVRRMKLWDGNNNQVEWKVADSV